MTNMIKVDRGELFDLLLAAENALDGTVQTFLDTNSPERLSEMRDSCAKIREELLG